MSKKIVVVGGLAAGPAAASKAKRTNPDAEVILIEKSNHISYGICELPYFLSNDIKDYSELFAFTPETLQSKRGVIVKTLNEVRDIDVKNRELIVLDRLNNKLSRLGYDKLILALGSLPKKIEELPLVANVFTFKSLEDALNLKKYIELNKSETAIIFGSGFIGLEIAEALAKIGLRVTVFEKEELPMPYFENKTRKKILELLFSNNIYFSSYSNISSFNIENNIVKNLEIDGINYKSDVIINSIGVVPNTLLLKGTGINLGKTNGVIVNQKMLTNIDGIYSCGDCSELKNLITQKNEFFSFANLAKKTGWIAGENAAGGMMKFKGVIPSYGLKIFGFEFAHVGLTFNKAISLGYNCERVFTEALIYPKMISSQKIYIEMIFDSNSKILLGADLYGENGCALRANILSVAIYNKMTLSDISQIDMVYHPLLTPQNDPIHFCSNLGI